MLATPWRRPARDAIGWYSTAAAAAEDRCLMSAVDYRATETSIVGDDATLSGGNHNRGGARAERRERSGAERSGAAMAISEQ